MNSRFDDVLGLIDELVRSTNRSSQRIRRTSHTTYKASLHFLARWRGRLMRCSVLAPVIVVAVLAAAGSSGPRGRIGPGVPSKIQWLVQIEPFDLGQRMRDELPAEVVIELNDDRAAMGTGISLDTASIRITRCDSSGISLPPMSESKLDENPPFRWYDESIPYDFPEFHDSVSRTAGELRPKPRERGGYYLNAVGDGRKGRLVWMHTQVGNEPAWYGTKSARVVR